MNTALVFVKPHAAMNEKVREVVKKKLEAAGCNVTSTGEIVAETIDKENLVDIHYYAIASKAVLLQPDQLPVPADKFEGKFGITWESALEKGLCYNGQDAGKKFGLNAVDLEKKWRAAKEGGKMIKFGGGFYCAELDGCYVFNAFFMSMRNKYVKPGAMIYYMKVEFDPKTLSWSDFRIKVIGATDPSIAGKESIRGTLFADWESLGLESKLDTGSNGVHGSASPFESLGERINWCNEELKSDPFAQELIARGISAETISAWTKDPQVVIEEGGKKGSLFDALEDLDYEDCLAAAVELNKLNQPATSSDDAKHIDDEKKVDEAKPAVVEDADASKEADDAKEALPKEEAQPEKETQPAKEVADASKKADDTKEAQPEKETEPEQKVIDEPKGTDDKKEAQPVKETQPAQEVTDESKVVDDKKEALPAKETQPAREAADAGKEDNTEEVDSEKKNSDTQDPAAARSSARCTIL